MKTLTNQKSRTVSSWLLFGLNLHERMWINQKRSHFWAPCCNRCKEYQKADLLFYELMRNTTITTTCHILFDCFLCLQKTAFSVNLAFYLSKGRLLTATEDSVEFPLKTALISVIVFFRLALLKEVWPESKLYHRQELNATSYLMPEPWTLLFLVMSGARLLVVCQP